MRPSQSSKQSGGGNSHALKDPPPAPPPPPNGAAAAATAASSSSGAHAAESPPPRKRRGRPPKIKMDAVATDPSSTTATMKATGASSSKRQRKGCGTAAGTAAPSASFTTVTGSGLGSASLQVATSASVASGAAQQQQSEFQHQLREMRVEMEIFPHGRAKGRRKRQRRSMQELQQHLVPEGAEILRNDDDESEESDHNSSSHGVDGVNGGVAAAKKSATSSKKKKAVTWSARRVQMALDRRDHEELLVERDRQPRTRGARAAESVDFLTGREHRNDEEIEEDEVGDDEEGGAGSVDSEDADDQGSDDEGESDDAADDDDDDDEDFGMGDVDELNDEEEYDNVILEDDDSDAVDDEEEGDGEGVADRTLRAPDADDGADGDCNRKSAAIEGGKTRRIPRRFRRTAPRPAAGGDTGASRRNSRSKLFRMRNFKSIRMADKHGDALASFAKGRHREAIAKLQDVAKDLPSAPQVYASLAMVYEEMLSDLEKNPPPESAASATATASPPTCVRLGKTTGTNPTADAESSPVDPGTDTVTEVDPQGAWLAEQLVIAKKAYGSYHIAALLCKKDYSFWVRAGDMAATIAGLHTQFMTPGRLLQIGHRSSHEGENSEWEKHLEHHRSEKQRWLTEAKSDYKAADSIKPPGIDIPAKLAAVCMELGSLSEALTILTDLKHRQAVEPGERSEFEVSHKACLLYADLMLRIGYECRRWNDGDHTVGNVSLRRWLRTHAKTFDWEERRLSALGMALEAAAGTKCCRYVSMWLKRRAERTESRVVPSNDDEATDEANSFEGEKALLLEKSRQELQDFDRTTADIDPDSNLVSFEKRQKARKELLSSHATALTELEREFGRTEIHTEPADSNPESVNVSDTEQEDCTPLPLSASTRSVCAIASELMRHLLLLKAYEGGRLVGEAVSLYLRQRAAMQEKSAYQQRRIAERGSRIDTLLQEGVIESTQEDFADDDSVEGLSDEEDLLHESPSVLESMRKGLLTPELNVLLAACLLGQRNRDFVAFKCLQAIESLELESVPYFREAEVDTGVSYDTRWTVFKRLSTGPLHRTEAFALVHRAVRDSGRAPELCARLLPLLEEHVQRLHDAQALDSITNDAVITFENLSVVFEVTAAVARFQLMTAESSIRQQLPTEANRLLKKSARTLVDAIRAMWTAKPQGAMPPLCMEVVETLSSALQLRFSIPSDAIEATDMFDWVELLGEHVSILSCCADDDEPSDVPLPATDRIPFPADWLGEKRRALALRSYNLSVSLNVARFSGWEDSEFRMELMRRRSNSSTYFGVTMSDGIVSGLLHDHENDVLEQWDILQELLVTKTGVSIRALMEARRSSPWYTDALESLQGAIRVAPVALQGEGSGLSVLLSYSRACLLAAHQLSDSLTRRGCILDALSILLPVLQFMLKFIVWEADIGKVSETRATVMDWRNSIPFEESKDDATQRLKRSRRRTLPEQKEETREWVPLHGAFAGERATPVISNLIVVPCDTLLRTWNEDYSLFSPPSVTSSSINDLSANVLNLARQLRLCHSEEAAEAASIQLAAATIDLIPHPHCQNPFKCLQMASMYASQGSKLGSSDSLFRAPLPSQKDCSPRDALAILGRAECMQALHFCTEAAFLCDYIVSVCRMHRRSGNLKRWSVVRALAYNTSVAVRHTAGLSLSDSDKKADALEWKWRKETIDELLRGREDCMNFVGMVRSDSSTDRAVSLALSVAHQSEQAESSAGVAFQEGKCVETMMSRPGSSSLLDEDYPALSDVVEV